MGAAVAPSAGTRAAAKETGRVGGRGARCMLGVVVAVAARCTAGGVVTDQFGAGQCEEDVSELGVFRDELGWNMCPVRRG